MPKDPEFRIVPKKIKPRFPLDSIVQMKWLSGEKQAYDLWVHVQVLESTWEWGRWNVLVTPTNGMGTRKVREDKLLPIDSGDFDED